MSSHGRTLKVMHGLQTWINLMLKWMLIYSDYHDPIPGSMTGT